MPQNNDKQHILDEANLFKSSLGADVPDTKSLQQRILQTTAQLPQETVTGSGSNIVKFPGFFKQAVPFALAASIALFAFLGLPSFLNQGSVDSVVANGLSIDDIEYQEAMLLYDELMFSQI